MKFSLYVFLLIYCLVTSCKLMHSDRSLPDNKEFGVVLQDHFNDRIRYFPIEATTNGFNKYNDLLPIEFTDSYLDTLHNFYNGYLKKILVFDRDRFNQNDQISYDIMVRQMKIELEGIDLHLANNIIWMPNVQYMPFNQFEGLPLFLGQMGGGTGVQPFKTVRTTTTGSKGRADFLPGPTAPLSTSEKVCKTGTFFPVAWWKKWFLK